MTITFRMRNVTSDSVHMIMLRKFFQMVFVGKDKRSLRIYTATIIGASEKEKKAGDEKPSFLSDLRKLKDFRMSFEFAVGQMDNNDVCSIEHEDLTDDESNMGFLQEIGCIRNVWGTQCSVIVNDQSQLSEKLRKIYENEEKILEDNDNDQLIRETARLSGKKILWTEQKKNNGTDEKLFQSLSVPGNFEALQDHQTRDDRDELAKRSEYIVKVPQDIELPQGIELVNWVRTTILFKYELDDDDLNFIIKKEPYGKYNQISECYYLAPDFTWYFSPAVKSYIDSKNCLVELKRGQQAGTQQKSKSASNDKFNNSFGPVPNKLTVNFHYWTETEKIDNRQKYRLSTKDILPKLEDFSEISEIGIFLDLNDEHSRGNRQFVLGIFLSFALSFGIDSTRLEQIDYCFCPLNRFFSGDVWWIFFLILCTLTWITKPPKLEVAARKLRKWQRILLICSLIWVVVVFAVLRSPLMVSIVAKYKFEIGIFAGIVFAVICIAHICYLSNKEVNLGENFLKNFFQGKIL